jgi:hypothetical protein
VDSKGRTRDREDIADKKKEIRELAQKPHAPHAAFLHCAKPHVETKTWDY